MNAEPEEINLDVAEGRQRSEAIHVCEGWPHARLFVRACPLALRGSFLGAWLHELVAAGAVGLFARRLEVQVAGRADYGTSLHGGAPILGWR